MCVGGELRPILQARGRLLVFTLTVRAVVCVESQKMSVNVRDVKAAEFIAEFAAYLKSTGKFEVPSWTDLVKTGINKELPPQDPDWYYIRAAAIARKVYMRHVVGVGALKREMGGSMRRGVRKNTTATCSGAIIRSILQQLQALKIVEPHPRGGRRITPTGQRELDRIAGQVRANQA